MNAEICVVGRCRFDVGIGHHTYAYCELLARNFPVCILPTEPELRDRDEVVLPSGRKIPVWKGQALKASIFVDVLWNGAYDTNYELTPQDGLRLALVVFDSDLLPPEWTRILNERFDGAIVTSPHMRDVLEKNGVTVPVSVIPLPLNNEPLLRRPAREWRGKTRIGSIAAFHPRKGADVLVSAFAQTFGDRDDVELVLHSNLSFSRTVENLKRQIADLGLRNVVVSTDNLSDEDKSDLISSFDVFASFSRGEAYSIGPREALSAGAVLALSDVGGHSDLADVPGVFLTPARLRLPARYVEIDNRVFGEQRGVVVEDAAATLKRAVEFVESGRAHETRTARRAYAGALSFSRMSTAVAELLEPDIRAFRRDAPQAEHVSIPASFKTTIRGGLAARGGFSHKRARVIQAHDGGFFSLFNTYFSHMAWDLKDERCHRTLPDWDVNRFLERQNGAPATSFCYGRPEDGNAWTQLFEPVFDLTVEQMNDGDLLYANAVRPDYPFNEAREPTLTYVHAYRLYKTPQFRNFRRHYNRIYRDHIRLHPELAAEIDRFAADLPTDGVLLGAHVRHPSHAIEQPGEGMAHTESYIQALKAQIRDKQLEKKGAPDWKIFLATDQESVVRRFAEEFGDRACWFTSVERTKEADDAKLMGGGAELQRVQGHQVQHLMAASVDTWSADLARQVIRDAVMLSRCQSMLHVVSNVSTAVSYMNPDCELIFCRPGEMASTG
ncbi:glycosyltransferase [Caulobacter radicis]|uniref:glycosyltransferase n=1 Tax=Caulobacter radicis TaxID=2172650 RepID=UPI001403BFAF|nr:glycosyltransferase [Caulobacter radicis]